ncbi:helix-turn-helix domain-containing protein [Streptococcus suis]|nr:helix-turn-helix domain-containing protein [Streptococcus suis]
MTKLTLRALRTNYSMTAKEVADDLDIHQQTLLKYEQDSTRIPIDLLQKLAEYYRVNMNDIFLGNKYELKRNLKQ